MRLVPSSLRQRLLLGSVAIGVSFVTVFGLAASWRIHHAEDQAVRAALQSRVELARDQVAADGSLRQDAGSPKTDLVQVLGPDGAVRSASASLQGRPPLVGLPRTAGPVQATVALHAPDTDLAVLGVPVRVTRTATSAAGTGLLVVAVDREGFTAATSDVVVVLLVGLLAVVLAIGCLSWVVTGRTFRSVTRLTEDAEQVRPQDLATGLPPPTDDTELGRLVRALNRMLARLHASHATELAFAADAGHRLRTPVATLRAEAELALRQPDPDERTAALERIVADADRLTVVVDRMLSRTRDGRLDATPFLPGLEEAIPRWRRLAAVSGCLLAVEVDRSLSPTTTCPDAVEVLDPIVENAARHADPGTKIRVSVSAPSGRLLTVDVANDGAGVPDQVAGHLFDAWVSSRDASLSGGLGLWLARETARDAGGDVRLADPGPPTTRFVVELPCDDGG